MKVDLVLMLVTTCSNAVLFNSQSLEASKLQVYNSAKKSNHLLNLLHNNQWWESSVIATILAASSAIVTVVSPNFPIL